MAYEVSVKVQVHIDVPGWRDDVPLEFYSSGSSYAEVRAGTQEFVKDYIAFHKIENIKKIDYIYADKEGIIKESIEEIFNKI
jgi:hypothetical protein